MKLPELLAPAGDFECLEAVFDHGADAAYIGIGPFNLRAQSPNFTLEEIPQTIEYAKERSRGLYAVFNTMPSDAQLGMIEPFFTALAKSGSLPDAIVISDPGLLSLCKEYLGGCALHLSTQTGTFNLRALQFWARQGIRRVILPRELTLEQIRLLCGAGICETELFIHGAMCVAISGRCLLGAYLAGRHPNQGECPQPCRFEYDIAPRFEQGGKSKEWFTALEQEQGVYLLNSKDLNTLPILPDIIATGVSSLKIEGRNKSVHYVSSVVKTYRAALDRYGENPGAYSVDSEWIDELDRLDHRPYTTGFYAGEYALQEPCISKVKSCIRVVGIVKGLVTGGNAVIDVRNPFVAGEQLTVLPVNRKKNPYAITFSRLSDINGNRLDRAITNRIAVAEADQKLSLGDIVRRMIE